MHQIISHYSTLKFLWSTTPSSDHPLVMSYHQWRSYSPRSTRSRGGRQGPRGATQFYIGYKFTRLHGKKGAHVYYMGLGAHASCYATAYHLQFCLNLIVCVAVIRNVRSAGITCECSTVIHLYTFAAK